MQKWEYRVLMIDWQNADRLVQELNRLGAEGWEAIGFNSPAIGSVFAYTFKRPLG